MENGFGSEKTRGMDTGAEATEAEAMVGIWSRGDELGKRLGELSVRISCVASNRNQLWLTTKANKENVLAVLLETQRTEGMSEEPGLEQMGFRQLRGSWWLGIDYSFSQVILWKQLISNLFLHQHHYHHRHCRRHRHCRHHHHHQNHGIILQHSKCSEEMSTWHRFGSYI